MGIFLNEKVQSYQLKKINYNNLGKYKSIIVGEIHKSASISIYRKLLSHYHFDYFICEFVYEDRCLDMETLKSRLDNASDGTFTSPCDYQNNYIFYKLAYDYKIPLIGCNPNNGKYRNMNDEDNYREAFMLKTVNEFIPKGKCLVQLEDHHLRSIPISKEFLSYCNDTEDDRGIYKSIDDLVVDHSSPIFEKYKNSSDTLILRVKDEYDNELKFTKKMKEGK